VLDLIEWANGPATSTWGAKRAAAGHPEPFHLEYLGIGNEDKITPEFEQRFKIIYAEVKAKHPEITIVGTAGPFHSGEDFEKAGKLPTTSKYRLSTNIITPIPNGLYTNQYRYDNIQPQFFGRLPG
jgi:hypothetical protein